MRTRHSLTIYCALLFLICTPAFAAEKKAVFIHVVGDSHFDVIYHRAASNGTGAALGGLIGAGIQAGVEAGKDGSKRDALRGQISASVWKDTFVKTLAETLVAKDYEVFWYGDAAARKSEKDDKYLTIYPQSYGFKMVDTSTRMVSSYVEFQISFLPEEASSHGTSKANKTTTRRTPKESFYLANRKQSPYETLSADGALMNLELEEVLTSAAQRLANKLIYNVKP